MAMEMAAEMNRQVYGLDVIRLRAFNFTGPGGLELHKLKGRPQRLVDRREH